MPSTKFVLRMVVLAMALAVAAFASSSPASNGQPDPAIHTVLQPDLTLHSTFSLSQRTNNLGKATTSGFCLGSCGIRCTTDANCGPGGRCVRFVICNDKTGNTEWNDGIGLSSHRGEMPALNINCK